MIARAPSAYQTPKTRLASPSAGAIRLNERPDAGARERQAEAGREQRHRDGGEEGEERERDHGDRRGCGSRRAAGCRRRRCRPCRARGRSRMPAAASGRVECGCARDGTSAPCAWQVDVAAARSWACRWTWKSPRRQRTSSQTRECDDHEADRRLRALLHPLRQVGLEEHDRQTEGEQRGRVAEAPGEAERRGGRASSAPCRRRSASSRRRGGPGRSRGAARGGSRRRSRCRSVAPSEKCAIQLVEAEHQLTWGRARTVIARPRPRTTSALTAGRSRTTRAVEVDAVEDALRRHGEEADRGHRGARPTLKARIRTSP